MQEVIHLWRPQKSLNFGPPTPTSLLPTNMQFSSKQTSLLDVLNWHSNHFPALGNFGIFLENFNKDINIVTYSFFFAIIHIIFTIPGFSQTWKTWKTLRKAYILDNSGKTWRMSLKNKFSWKIIMVEGKAQGNYFSLIIFSYSFMFLDMF